MTQEKLAPASQGLFGLTGRDIALLSLLIVFLIGGFSFAYLLVRCKRGNVNFLCSAATPAVVATPTAVIPTVKPTEEMAAAQATDPVPETATALPPTPTQEKPTSTATNVPSTSTTTPSQTPTQSPSATSTATATNLPAATAALTPTAAATATATATSTPTPTLTSTPAPVAPIATPTPQPATIVYVQGGGLPSSLGIVTSAGELINDKLHGYAGAPAWSPDGKKIAFFGEPGIGQLGVTYGLGEGIWTIDYPGGGNPTQLFITDHVKSLTWSPNGEWLAFEFGPEGSTHETIVIKAADGQKVSNFPGEQPAWSPDSQKLVIKTCEPSCGLWQVNRDGGGRQQLTSDETDSFPALSPDGEYLSFTSLKRAGNWEIYRLRLADGEPLPLTNRPEVADTTPVFSRDGQEIYLLTGASAHWQVVAIALDGSNERLIKDNVGLGNEWGLARPAVY